MKTPFNLPNPHTHTLHAQNFNVETFPSQEKPQKLHQTRQFAAIIQSIP